MENMKKFAQIIYGLNIVIFVVIISGFLYGCFLFLSSGSSSIPYGVVVLIILSIIWSFFISKLRKLKAQGKFTTAFVWGCIFSVIPAVLIIIFLLPIAFGGG